VQALDALLPTKERVVDRADQVIKALRLFKAGMALMRQGAFRHRRGADVMGLAPGSPNRVVDQG
jgi:hypothetical protein